MIARLTSPCICGQIVRPGMEIAFDHHMRRVVMCPKCAPSAGRKRKYKAGAGVVVVYKAAGWSSQAYRVQSLRDRQTGALAGFVVRWAAGDSDPRAWVKFIWRNGQFVRQDGFSIEAPTHLTTDDLQSLVGLAKTAAALAA